MKNIGNTSKESSNLMTKREAVISTATSMESTSVITTSPSMTSLSTTTPTSSTPTNTGPHILETMASTSISTPVVTQPSTSASVNTSYESVDPQNENLTPNISCAQNQINCLESAEIFHHLNANVKEIEEQVSKMDSPLDQKLKLNEKLVVIKDFYLKILSEQMKSIQLENKRLKVEVQAAKKGRWCVVCQKMAKHYCCVRFYCSIECQRADWRTGHSSQCLDRAK